MKYFKFIYTALLLLIIASCTPDEFEGGLGPVPTSDLVNFTTTPTAENPNIVKLKNETPGVITAIWDLGNGATAVGNEATGSYAVEGEYIVKLTVFTKSGYTSNTKKITIAETNVSMLNRPDYNFLTGGATSLNGKTWVIEKDFKGHLGVGPMDSATPSWWSANPNDKAGVGVYDDEMTFNLNGFAFTYKNNGDTYSNKDYATELGGTNGSEDVTVSYTPPTNMTWDIIQEGSKKYLILSNGGFMAYYVGVSKYEILALSENELYLKSGQKGVDGNAWWYRLVPKGYTRPVEAKPYKIVDIFDGFDEDGSVTWKKEALTLHESYDNPAPVPINTSPKAALYVKQEGTDFKFANMFTDFEHKLDIRERHIFKMKVYIPGYNDYVTAIGEDWANKNLLKQVSIKLQNSEAGEPWANQAEVKQQVTTLDQWVELTFDFYEFKTRADFDRIVIQIGGEGNHIAGVFFLDDFRLMP